MSMTREEAIKFAEHAVSMTDIPDVKEFYRMSAAALRPVSREQVEKVWRGCEKCHNQDNWPSWIEKGFVYCPKCGTPLTSWAWEKQVERLEALYDKDVRL